MRLMAKTSAYSLTEAQDAWIIFDTRRGNKRVWQFELTSGTATLVVEGRIGSDTWVESVSAMTADGDGVLDVFPQMRVRFTAANNFIGFFDLDADGRKLAGFVGENRTDS